MKVVLHINRAANRIETYNGTNNVGGGIDHKCPVGRVGWHDALVLKDAVIHLILIRYNLAKSV